MSFCASSLFATDVWFRVGSLVFSSLSCPSGGSHGTLLDAELAPGEIWLGDGDSSIAAAAARVAEVLGTRSVLPSLAVSFTLAVAAILTLPLPGVKRAPSAAKL